MISHRTRLDVSQHFFLWPHGDPFNPYIGPLRSGRSPETAQGLVLDDAPRNALPSPARNNTPPPWLTVRNDDVRAAIEGTPVAGLVDVLASVADPPLPLELTLGKALALIGTELSQPVRGYDPVDIEDHRRGIDLARTRIMTAGGQACNTWHLCVAASGSWKDAGNLPDKLAAECGWSIGTSGSAEGLADAFRDNGGGLLIVSEFSPGLQARHWQYGASSWMTSAFNKGHFKVVLSRYRGGTREARFCFPSMIANVQPEILAMYATPSMIDSGFLPRFLITRLRHREAWRPATRALDTRPAVQILRRYAELQDSIIVPPRYMDDLLREFIAHDAKLPGHYSRLVNEYGPRLALMLAGNATLETDDWTRAATLLRWFYAQAEAVLTDVSASEDVRRTRGLLERMAAYIQKHGKVSKTDFAHQFSHDANAKERDRLLHELQDRGDITIYVKANATTIFWGGRDMPQLSLSQIEKCAIS